MMIDYRDLLMKYMAHVVWNEGTTFLGRDDAASCSGFNDEEFAELKKLDQESRYRGPTPK